MSAFPLREPSIAALADAPVYFRYGSAKRRILVDGLTARAILLVHGAASPEQQAKVARMVAGSPGQLSRIADFAMRHCTLA